ncbi:inner membrane protein YbaL [Variibacter gotjawalensis]|uniref:Inner membrane protein YbaL n=1 Tax=Variibacter gotjawalensis TaxID=1333996 RepID=A0A0S3Q0I9_9BRAD|nr:YbaL family putative K(+) efflux transporter [Variibacter gotjawalensis]NIK47533.1 CPA2 family monovalent cation:H+ antiporter-2 [Variibacter gotjawalensis]RZS49430.1 Kef-type potassium/proton antiporter (CPA2 family) [Variibacter gotjawalensis]BAT61693.1 inner membrane protein YbaL [Variibacter gotjawalensis]
MEHHTPLISTIVVGLVLAFLLGAAAQRIKVSPLVGYLLAGVAMGPFTPGFVGDQNLANQLAEIGVILLMFGVGLHFSLKDLLSVRAIAIPGAIVQMGAATLLGLALAWALKWPLGAGIVFGLALSVASTVVLLRALQERRLVETDRGRIAVGWLIVEDLAMVLALVLIPALAGLLKGEGITASTNDIIIQVGLTLTKVAVFVGLMLVVGRRVIPWTLHYVAHTGSRELFRLSVLAIALGFAYVAATLFGASFALGAFFAGMVLAESELSHRAAQESLPLRDAFAVLFFVSVGMLFDPMVVVKDALPVLATVAIIVVGKSLAAYAIVRLFGHSQMTALTISASLAQIGEFSFILIGLGVSLAILPERGRDLVLAGAIISIMLNPILFVLLDWFTQREAAKSDAGAAEAQQEQSRAEVPVTKLTDHVVLVGHGRVGRAISQELIDRKIPLLVIEAGEKATQKLKEDGVEVINENAADPVVAKAANFGHARCLLVAIPDGFEGGQVVQQARNINENLPIIARSHSDDQTQHLRKLGASRVIMGENEIARAMFEDARSLGADTAPTHVDSWLDDGATLSEVEGGAKTVAAKADPPATTP